ncbi:CerR family C-terminal domain-containing protein [Paenarthrobacter sp. NPDC056912]|uniref:CerR family C-terminal domain-containing protein n=1 Tax=Paenarthrobacter sp. NPDC056912 TaxID=3345965 RepID=UPI003671C74A
MTAVARSGRETSDTAQPASRKDSILRAAERLFAINGYHGTTMRDVAGEAGVKLALLVYHFETKENLYFSTFENRQYINNERLERLRAIEDPTAPGSLEKIIDAFVEPALRLHDNAEDAWFARLVLREASDPSSQDRRVISTLFDPLAREFIDVIKAALPDKPAGFHHWAYVFSVGALTQSVFETRVGNIADEPRFAMKADALKAYLLAAFTHG